MRPNGFTLLELLIALAVLAVVALAVYGHGGDTVRQLHGMEERTLARWVAENEIAKLRLRRLSALAERNALADDRAGAGSAAGDDTGTGEDVSASSDRGVLPLGANRQRIRQGKRTWQVLRETYATSDRALYRVEVSVFAVEGGREIGPLDTLTAFVGRY